MYDDVHRSLEFGILGPLRISVDGGLVAIPAAKQRALLAALILHAGRTLVLDKLTDAVWDDDPPRQARGAIQAYIMRLRRVLDRRAGKPLIRTVPGGYLLDVDEDTVDAARFRLLARQAERSAAAGRFGEASSELGEALKLWRGQPLEDVESDSLHRSEVLLLVEQRLSAAERRIELELALGHHRDVIAELNSLVAAHSLRERYWYLLILALHRSGRRADALAAYRHARRLFIAELSIEPGDELRDLHDAILADRPVLPRPAARHHPPAAAAVKPPRENAWIRQCQLPRDVSDFVGRAEIGRQIAADISGSSPAVPIVALCGPAGVGKTTLAVRVAHQMRRQFPDGQLYARLGEQRSRAAGLARLLADLMVATGRQRRSIPDGLDQRAAAFRAWLADRRVLLVIDNVTSAAQVRHMMPGTPGCAAILTSRHDLRALTVLDGAHHYPLGVLEAAEAIELLEHMLGSRAAGEPATAAELAALCGYLPLALRIAAADLVLAPNVPLPGYAARLAAHACEPGLATESASRAAVQAVFDVPYDQLDPALGRLLALLGEQQLPVSDVAALLSTGTAEVAQLLDHLARRELFHQVVPGGLLLAGHTQGCATRTQAQHVNAGNDSPKRPARRRHSLRRGGWP